jgi:hypothetical protein
MYVLRNKLECLFKPIKDGLTLEKTLAYYEFFQFFVNYESVILYSKDLRGLRRLYSNPLLQDHQLIALPTELMPLAKSEIMVTKFLAILNETISKI